MITKTLVSFAATLPTDVRRLASCLQDEIENASTWQDCSRLVDEFCEAQWNASTGSEGEIYQRATDLVFDKLFTWVEMI